MKLEAFQKSVKLALQGLMDINRTPDESRRILDNVKVICVEGDAEITEELNANDIVIRFFAGDNVISTNITIYIAHNEDGKIALVKEAENMCIANVFNAIDFGILLLKGAEAVANTSQTEQHKNTYNNLLTSGELFGRYFNMDEEVDEEI